MTNCLNSYASIFDATTMEVDRAIEEIIERMTTFGVGKRTSIGRQVYYEVVHDYVAENIEAIGDELILAALTRAIEIGDATVKSVLLEEETGESGERLRAFVIPLLGDTVLTRLRDLVVRLGGGNSKIFSLFGFASFVAAEEELSALARFVREEPRQIAEVLRQSLELEVKFSPPLRERRCLMTVLWIGRTFLNKEIIGLLALVTNARPAERVLINAIRDRLVQERKRGQRSRLPESDVADMLALVEQVVPRDDWPKHKTPQSSRGGFERHEGPGEGFAWPHGSGEPPAALRHHLREGRIVPFLGPGASLTGPVPALSARRLAEELAAGSDFPISDYDPIDLPRIASFYEARMGRPLLNGALRDALAGPFEPGRIHRFLARVGERLLVITTNYDELLEQAFRAAGHDPHVVYHPFDDPDRAGVVLWHQPDTSEEHFEEILPEDLSLPIGRVPVIYKMLGHRHRGDDTQDAYLITEEDYVEFLAGMRVPPVVLRKLKNSSILFLGYGLRDWNARVLLRNLRRVGRGFAWAVERDPRVIDERLWHARNVEVLRIELDAFAAQLEAMA